METLDRSSRLRRRGTASVEVVMMLPFFFIVFFGIYWIHGHYSGRQQAMLRARSCGWVYAAGACEDKKGLEACLKDDGRPEDSSQKAGGSTSGKWPNPDSSQQTPTQGSSDPNDPSASADQDGPPAQAGGELGGSNATAVFRKLEGIPLLGSAIKWLFGKPVTIDAHEPITVPEPTYLGHETQRMIDGSYHTLCNSKPEGWQQLAHDIFCKFVGKFPGC